MDLRKYSPTPEQLLMLKEKLGYQPFIISDTCMSGAGYYRFERILKLVMEKEGAEGEWERFRELNSRMIKMYDDWIAAACETVGQPGSLTVVDTGCNTGYFLYSFLERGVARAIGYDLGDFDDTIALLNEVTGFNAEFHRTPYDTMRHTIDGVQHGDIVVSTAVMVHLSDPTYYLSFLGSITKKVLLLHTAVDESDEFFIKYLKQPRRHYDNPFPICFDGYTRVSSALLEFGLRELGFTTVRELPYDESWLPYSFYKSFKTYIAVK